jgi:hypothetical protein
LERGREAVTVSQERYRVTQLRIYRLVCQHCNSQRHFGMVVDHDDDKLRHRLREFAAEHVRVAGELHNACYGLKVGSCRTRGYTASGASRACSVPPPQADEGTPG